VICPVGTIKVRLHEDEQEVEISPFKSRAKLVACRQCGAPVVSELVVMQTLDRAKLDSEELRERMRLCPKCRKSRTVAGLASTSQGSGREI
jgi:hypothetical protein